MESLQQMSDADLLALYSEADEETVPELVEAILEEIERRKLNL